MTKTYHGSCHCKAVTYEVELDLEKGTGKCNCTYCWKIRNWSAQTTPAQFRLLTGAEVLGDYGRSGEWGEGHHRFCTRCGVTTHGHGHIEAMGGPYVGVQVSTLDDLPVTDLLGAPIHHADGLRDNWMNRPEEIRHL
jgi:hypothetical protein